ncbi:MAG: DUF3617 domain-containing protein [Oxalobacteraceae bacterium]|nr:MAG: DUF3617 domain-containing protein [Oxalobacteraceae bacterium]
MRSNRQEFTLPRFTHLLTHLFTGAVLAFSLGPASAADIAPRPGLWEISATNDLLALAPQIPSDQMDKLRALARQHGFDMPRIENGAASSRICITPEMAAQNTMPDLYQQQSGCTTTNAVRNGARYSMQISCSGGQVRGNGRAEGTLESAERFSGITTFNGTVQGNPVNEQAQTSGRWVAASCGGLGAPR